MQPPSSRPRRHTLVAAASLLALVGAAVVVPASAASAATVAMTIAVGADGHGPFTEADQPGGDASDHNGIVRTDDSVVYEVTVNAAGGVAADETFTLRAPAHTRWASLPSDCLPAGSSMSGDELVCRLGDLTNETKKVSVVLGVTRAAVDGERITPTGSVAANGVDPVAAGAVDAVTVSAAPRFDLSVNTVTPTLVGATGPDGTTPGFRITYPILLDWKGLVAGDGLLGYERLRGDVGFTDDVSKMFGDGPSTARLQGADGEAPCGVNTGQFPTLPGGRGGGKTSVVDSGDIRCTQSAPGQPVAVSISGIDSTLSSIPSQSLNGGAITGGTRAYVVSGYISLWVPVAHDVDNITAVNTYRDLVAPSATDQVNYGREGEPLGNNSISRYIGEFVGPVGSLHYYGDKADPFSSFILSGKYLTPYTTPGQLVHLSGTLNNIGATAWNGTLVCSVFDRSVQHLSSDATNAYAASSNRAVTGDAQFAVLNATTHDALRDATCDDDDAIWYDDPADVPGGPSAVGMVRWHYDQAPGQQLTFATYLRLTAPLADRTAIRSYMSVRPGEQRPWIHDVLPGDAANGTWADFLTVTSDLARITSKTVDEGHDASDTPDATKYVEQGKTVEFALYPTLTNATENGDRDTVTVRDVVPLGTTYVEGSASIAPTSVTQEVDGDGNTRQVLTWILPDHPVNTVIPPITFTVRAGSGAAVGPITNEATVSAAGDVSPESFRKADRGLYVLAVGAVSVVETARPAGVVVGDDLRWKLDYTNNADSAFDATDLITVLPYVGDGRGTTGDVRLKSVVEATASETVRYTRAASASIDLDPADESNDTGGATRWCTAASFGDAGCPSTLADATGVRIQRSAAVPVGTTVSHHLVAVAPSAEDGTVAGSSFGLRVANLSLPVTSNVATVTVHAGAIGHRAWFDKNSNGLQDTGEPGLAGDRVHLTGVDDRGDRVDASTTTDDTGDYRFDGLRPGQYTIAFGTADGGWTAPRVGDDPAVDSDVDANGDAVATLTADRDDDDDVTAVTNALNIDAGALPKLDPVLPPDITPPDHGGAADHRPGAGGSHASAAGPDRLAFTGPFISLWGGTAAAPRPAGGRPLRLGGRSGPFISLWAGTAAALALILVGLALAARRRRSRVAEDGEPGLD